VALDGTVYIANTGGNAIVKVTPSGTTSAFPISGITPSRLFTPSNWRSMRPVIFILPMPQPHCEVRPLGQRHGYQHARFDIELSGKRWRSMVRETSSSPIQATIESSRSPPAYGVGSHRQRLIPLA
jgi:hypothetical protein